MALLALSLEGPVSDLVRAFPAVQVSVVANDVSIQASGRVPAALEQLPAAVLRFKDSCERESFEFATDKSYALSSGVTLVMRPRSRFRG